VVSALLAFAAAFSSSLNVVTQHLASTAAPPKVKGFRLAVYLVHNPLWLFGVIAMVGSFVLQAAALRDGELSVVQSILITELVFSLVLARLWLKRAVAPAAWLSALLTTAGLAVFLVMAEPKGGHAQATAGAWLWALLTLSGLTAAFTGAANGGSPIRRAACYAIASGIAFAALATFLKSATDVLTSGGVSAVLQQGAVYGVVVTGIVGTILSQAALHYGPLSVSQPLMVIVNPFVSIILGVWIYGEHFEGGSWKIFLGVVGFAAMVIAVVLLARTAPSFEAAPGGPTTARA
jgi:drug/metabolite transporter (DMT)-like permease